MTIGAPEALTAQSQTEVVGQRAGRGQIGGRVTDERSQQPIVGATVSIVGTTFRAASTITGRYDIINVPPGVYALEARRIGYGVLRFDNVRIGADSAISLDFKMLDNPLRLDQVVVSATMEATTAAKSTVTVDRLSAEDMPVPVTTSAAGAILGKVAGAAVHRPSGRPGSGVNVVLRTPIGGIDQDGSSPGPLYVVDGVFLNSQQQVTTQDIEALDIASIEVLKGAAAAALYGSRAAAGVISITTNRGQNMGFNSTEFSVRTEYGVDQFQTDLQKNQHHQYRMDAQGNWLNAAGAIVPRDQRVVTPFGFMDQPYNIPTYDHAKQLFSPGKYATQTVTMQGNSASTNFNVAYSRTRSPGVLQYNDGFTRQSFRTNVDARIAEKFNLGVSLNHTRGRDDEPNTSFNNYYRFDTDVNLLSINPFPTMPGFPYNIVPDSVTDATNPLYSEFVSDIKIQRSRTLLAANAGFRPTNWVSINADISYDRGDLQETAYTPRGTVTNSSGTLGRSTGSLRIDNDITDGINAAVGPTFTQTFGDLTARATLRGEVQRETNPFIRTTGTDFTTEGLKNMSAARTRTVSQTFTDRRAIAQTGNLGLSYSEKYIGDFLIRHEGSSLFGNDKRWSTFYRASGAWLLSEEAWFPVLDFTTFKLRYSIGTAGNRPGFSSQYEALTADASGVISRSTLGNPNLEPTISTEQELGLDMTFKRRVSASVVYVSNVAENVFVSVPAPAVSGYSNVLRNTGKITGNTIETTVQGQILSNPNGLQWTMLLVADKTRNFVSEFKRTCFDDGLTYRCDGVRLGSMYGNNLVTAKTGLRPEHQATGAASLDQFDVNDEGFVVPVGAGNTWRDGVAKNLWGTTVNVDGFAYPWGHPIVELDPVTRQLKYGQIGDGNPDVKFGWSNTFRVKNWRLFVQTTGQLGGDVYANSNQTYYASGDHPDVDQFGKPDELKKPVSYYNAASNNNNLFLANFVEDGTHLTVSEVLVGYTLDQKQWATLGRFGVSRLQMDLIGRNMKTFTGYTGLNVMAGSPQNRFDDASYPLTRTLSGVFTITF